MNIQNNVAGTMSVNRAYLRAEAQLPNPAGLRNQGLVQKGQLEARGVPKHTVTLSPRLMLDAPLALYYNKRYMNKYGMQ